jgi:hypothetical protein
MQRAAAALALCLAPVLSLGCAAPVTTDDAPESLAQAAQADEAGPLGVDFAGCTEVANVGLAPTANIRPLVPAQFTLSGGTGPTTSFVVRTVHCNSISVDGNLALPGDLVQIGAVIVAPDGDGDINNYTFYYDTNHLGLALRLAERGVPARWVPVLQESVVLKPDGSGQYHFDVPAPFEPQMTFAGAVGAPVEPPIPFTANWWSTSNQGTVKMATALPVLYGGTNSVVLTLPERSPLANALGTDVVSSWPTLILFDNFPTAHMNVTVR